jgi:fatty-acyl-CoA synthase
MSAGDLLTPSLQRHPQRRAVVDAGSGRVWTYADLDRRASQAAQVLRQRGVGRGDLVAWIAWNRGELVEALIACLRVGAALVPLNPGATPWERARHLRLTGPAVIVDGVGDRSLAGQSADVIVLDDTSSGYEQRVAAMPVTRTSSDAHEDAIGAVLFTSGSTSTPRGARLPQRMLLTNAAASAHVWDLSSSTVAAVVSPLWHAGGFGAMLLPTLHAGGTVVVLPSFDAETFWPTLARHAVTTMFGVPTLWQRALDAPGIEEAARGSLTWLLCGGAPMSLRLRDRYRAFGLPLRQGLGMTEAGINLCTPTPQDADTAPLSVGRPLPGITVAIDPTRAAAAVQGDGQATAATDAAAAPGGELVISGPCVAARYLGASEVDDETFAPDGRVRIGDLVRRDEDGRLWVVGRRTQVYTTSGFSVSPAEVELALQESADLDAVAVVPVPDENRGEVGHAFVVARAGRHVDAERLRSALRERLSGYKVPARIDVVADLPRTPSGKIDRHALAER